MRERSLEICAYLSIVLGGVLMWKSPAPLTSALKSSLSFASKSTVSKTSSLQSFSRDLSSKSEGAQKHPASIIANDPEIFKNWGFQASDALKAHGITKGLKRVKVAIIDTGIDIYHKDLKNNLWRNTGEHGVDNKGRNKATNGVDDDKNGFIDDIHGWNFVAHNHNLTDNHGHGTHIAGIVGAEGGNGFGITGIASNVSLMVLKYYDPKQPGDNLKNTIKAMNYAIDNGADIINYSGGGTEFSQQEYEVVRRARSKGILVVAAAGNERSNSDKAKYYPADYPLDNIISVTAHNQKGMVLPSSNYGTVTVDIAAPGENIYSTMPGNRFDTLTGTSQATAFASGLAALIRSNHPNFNYRHIKTHILNTGDEYPWLRSKTGTSKKLNIYKALTTLGEGVSASGVIAAAEPEITQNSLASTVSTPQKETSQFLSFSRKLVDKINEQDSRSINSSHKPHN